MKDMRIYSLTLILILIFFFSATCADEHLHFLECLSQKSHNNSSISNLVFTPRNSSYTSVLQFSIQNLRFRSESTSKPQLIITPHLESQIPPIIYCAKKTNLQIRTRSGGHDFEGLSYVAQVPFLIIDLINLSDIKVDVAAKAAWVQAGATIGTLYYKIAEKSPLLGFPAGSCLTVGVGGHFSGGGYGTLLRKHGLAADHIVDARIVDARGRILDRKSMGEDLFWAIRGGGGASFGVILAWKVGLVDVPEKVTVFRIQRSSEQNATQLVHRWQHVAPNFDKDLFVGVLVGSGEDERKKTTIHANFFSLFLGGIEKLFPLMQESFPELRLVREDYAEMSWIESTLYIAGFPIESREILLKRSDPSVRNFKSKSDYVQKPIPEYGLEGIWRQLFEPEAAAALVLLMPYGGRMAEISESAVPFPHRGGNLYEIAPVVYWDEDEDEGGDSERYIGWIRRLQSYLTPYVSTSPRSAYFNYRDLDLGVNRNGRKTSYARARVWGVRYFKNNFDRLVRVKTLVDPKNFFRNVQSIPPLHSPSEK